MLKRLGDFFEKLIFKIIDYFLRKKTLNFILYSLILITLGEATAWASNKELTELIAELKIEFPNGFWYYLLRFCEVFLIQGGKLVLTLSIIFTIMIWFLKKSEISKAHSGQKMKLINEGLEQKLQLANESLVQSKTQAELQEQKQLEYRKLLNKINYTLKEKNISKADILLKFDKKFRIIVLQKNLEDTNHYYIKEQFYPHVGAKNIGGGVCIIPPNKIDQKLSDKEILKWFENELNKFIPDNYKYNFAIISVVDLNSTITLNNEMHPLSRYKSTYLDAIDIDDILSFREIESYLYTEKNISSKEIIDLPSLSFLLDNEKTNLTSINKINDSNKEIVESLKVKLGINSLTTMDFAHIELNDLIEVLDVYISDSDVVAESIIENAKFWKDYFDNSV